ncbi:signal recognition particle-docking protein FtsY [Kyrpidia tusciae]|uniref:Signal recognition particle receptor FtsY n=1 Tax=Kyrpidia tusciae (strain DSM 2912 / NBRC 15312 / T2) TaxID=562970 RepID=D5WPA3_KYRT2|nr:signal recognition particle-docking protein FtsY [Kyrpidia tusciae]ADG06162.1 signal recognition particle-docking protein FtsY [Kyrpidia tusciae DSM 2912]
MGLFDRFRQGLQKTREAVFGRMSSLVTGRRRLDDALFDELEELLILADVGVDQAVEWVEDLRKQARERGVREAGELRPLLRELLLDVLGRDSAPLQIHPGSLSVVLVVGVNGAGKTTTLGKLAHRLTGEGRKVLLAAGDTFRAGAIEQLHVWGSRAQVDVIRQQQGSDPAAVVFDAIQAGRSRGVDVVLCDTAGRLHNKTNLMAELEKIRRVAAREVDGAPHEVLLVIDATTGQNALTQAELFSRSAGVTGVVLTKLDGTAKGGMALTIRRRLGIPVKFVGVGEGIEDLEPFDPEIFVDALLGTDGAEGRENS